VARVAHAKYVDPAAEHRVDLRDHLVHRLRLGCRKTPELPQQAVRFFGCGVRSGHQPPPLGADCAEAKAQESKASPSPGPRARLFSSLTSTWRRANSRSRLFTASSQPSHGGDGVHQDDQVIRKVRVLHVRALAGRVSLGPLSIRSTR